MNRALGFTLTVVICLGAFACSRSAGPPTGFAIILQADTDRHEGLARAVHALIYAKELKEGGYDVVLIFDGAGTGWAKLMRDPNHKLHAKFQELKNRGVIEEVCDFCAGAFKVKKDLQGAPLIGDFDGHPSLKKWIDKGYQVLIL